MKLPSRVTICEVGTRDGLQNEARNVPTDEKVALVNQLSAAHPPRIQVTAFVHPKVVPQMADADAVMRAIERRPGVRYSALVPNDRGAERALAAGVDEIDTVLSASETHNIANVNMTVAESLDRMEAVVRLTRAAGVPVVAGVSTAFGCPFEGAISRSRLDGIVERLAGMGVQGISLADTTGMANPRQVGETFGALVPRYPGVAWYLHTHDTRASAIPNILAAIEAGVTHFDASVGGLGGCPFAPGASGNVCTEDLVHLLHAMDVDTGIDLDALLETARYASALVGHELAGQVVKAGPATRRYPVPEAVQERLAVLGATADR